MMKPRFFGILLALLVSSLLADARGNEPPTTPGDSPGFRHARPKGDIPLVEVDDGYLVPYTCQIPGTDIRFKMTPIPAGRFTMGTDDSELHPDESPQRDVSLPPFWMGVYEVTWSEYWQFMALDDSFMKLKQLRSQVSVENKMHEVASRAVAPYEALKKRLQSEPNFVDAVTAPTPLYDPSTTYMSGEDPQQPAVTMTPYAARQYTKWLSAITGQAFRLPTEAEWEYAARAGAVGKFAFGNDESLLDDYAWYYDNADEQTHVVGSKRPNRWGLFDIHGNVAEWTLDAYREDGYPTVEAGKELTVEEAVVWPEKAYPRVARGGSWDSESEGLRLTARMPSDDEEWKLSDPNLPKSPWWFTEYPADGIGFRLLRQYQPLNQVWQRHAWEIDAESIRKDVEDRLDEGRGKLGRVDSELPEALEQLEKEDVAKLLGE